MSEFTKTDIEDIKTSIQTINGQTLKNTNAKLDYLDKNLALLLISYQILKNFWKKILLIVNDYTTQFFSLTKNSGIFNICIFFQINI